MTMSAKEPRFVKALIGLLEDVEAERLTAVDAVAYLRMTDASRDGICRVSLPRIGAWTCRKEDAATRTVRRLEAAGWLKTICTAKGECSSYRLLTPRADAGGARDATPRRDAGSSATEPPAMAWQNPPHWRGNTLRTDAGVSRLGISRFGSKARERAHEEVSEITRDDEARSDRLAGGSTASHADDGSKRGFEREMLSPSEPVLKRLPEKPASVGDEPLEAYLAQRIDQLAIDYRDRFTFEDAAKAKDSIERLPRGGARLRAAARLGAALAENRGDPVVLAIEPAATPEIVSNAVPGLNYREARLPAPVRFQAAVRDRNVHHAERRT
jgi:hypothetical protein